MRFFAFLWGAVAPLWGQPITKPYWQQQVAYDIRVRLDETKHLLRGSEVVTYHNHAPDTLDRVYFHLYYNAFQPGSMMDVRSRTIADPDPRVGSRIAHLEPEAQGYQKIHTLMQDGVPLRTQVNGTVLTAWLSTPLPPGGRTTFFLDFEAQIPVQIRRTGRDNKEGISYSMAQWYPKLAEYDAMGWHTHPYVGREFYGVWGDFEVRITLNTSYVVAATGMLQNKEAIGKGYAKRARLAADGGEQTWHFSARRVHDFVWAADPDYLHEAVTLPQGVVLRFFYEPAHKKNWKRLRKDMMKIFPLVERNFGKYPYDTYSVIQGGDGGMEYPMATLITADRSYESLLRVTLHELLHSWYQGVLGSNESLYAWLDEGFTTYATQVVWHAFARESGENPVQSSYDAYKAIVGRGKEERMNTWADHFTTNAAYSVASYAKGAVFQHQLSYVVGRETFARALHRYYEVWQFKHPTPADYMRIVEKASGMELDWYLEYFANTTHTIDYGIDSLLAEGEQTRVQLSRVSRMSMPVDVYVRYKGGKEVMYTIPLSIMNGHKKEEGVVPLPPWPWVSSTYVFKLPAPLSTVEGVTIDRTGRLADINGDNQHYLGGVTGGE